MTDREKHISVLQNIDRAYRTFTQEEYRALEYAIASLKTDLKYDLMYEGEEIYTKADMLSMLYKLRSEIINMPKYFPYSDHTRWFIDGDVFGLIDKQINALKENKDGNK